MRAALLALVLAAAPALAQKPHHHHHAAPSGVISLDVYADGGVVHVLMGESRDGKVALVHRRTSDGIAWSDAVRVAAGPAPRHLRRGDDAQVAARGQRVLALWGIEGTGYMKSGPFAAALSDDGGATWRAAPSPSDSGLTTGHGFAELMFDGADLHAVWLDSRDKSQGLRHARSPDGGMRWLANATVAPGTCECCWNALLREGEGVHVLYRGKGPRDMQMATLAGDQWRKGGSVGAFGWEFKGCPETGGRLVAAGGSMHALVWTGKEGRAGLYRLQHQDGKWSQARRVGGDAAQHADLAVSGELLLAAWDAAGGIFYEMSRDAGRTWSRPQRLATADATHPRVATTATGFLILWTQRDAGNWVLKTRAVAR